MIFIDLDGTFVHSKKIDNETVPVSFKFMQESRYMKTEHYNALLKLMERTTVIPITSRTLNSFYDISFSDKFPFALVENGAILLRNGTIDKSWVNRSECFLKGLSSDISQIKKIMYNSGYCEKWGSAFVFDFELRNNMVPDILALNKIKSNFNDNFSIFVSQSKRGCLCIPKPLEKGEAIKRFICESKTDEKIYIAGDSEPDFSMLSLPFETIGPINSPAKYKCKNNSYDYTDFVLSVITKDRS